MCFTIVELLGLPTIILHSTTDYAAPSRSINVTWLLNSTVPADILHSEFSQFSRVVTCNASIHCGNGHFDEVHINVYNHVARYASLDTVILNRL